MSECCDDQANEQMVPRTEDEIKKLVMRLKRIEGQVRGIQNMVEEDRYCIDILTQVMAANAALKKVGFSLMERHTNHCVTKAVQTGNGEEYIKELMDVMERFSK